MYQEKNAVEILWKYIVIWKSGKVLALPHSPFHLSHWKSFLNLQHNPSFRVWTFPAQDNKGNKWQILSSGSPQYTWNLISIKQVTCCGGWAELLVYGKETRKLNVGLPIWAMPLQDRWCHLPFSTAFLSSNLHELWDNTQPCLICKSGTMRDKHWDLQQ